MKLISWNVNGLRACLTKGFSEFFESSDADIFCVQETKMQQGQTEYPFDGYFQYWHSAVKKGYSGTAVFCKQQPISVNYDIDQEEHSGEGRAITLEFPKFYLVNVYTPNSKRDLSRLENRMEWEDAFRAYVCRLDQKKPVVICGDMNVAHQEIDLKHPKANQKNSGFTPEERGKMTELLQAGFLDSFRVFYPQQEDAYSWWSYRFQAREKNAGWRIDYFLVSERLRSQMKNAKILPEIKGSDHCPVLLELSDAFAEGVLAEGVLAEKAEGSELTASRTGSK